MKASQFGFYGKRNRDYRFMKRDDQSFRWKKLEINIFAFEGIIIQVWL